VSLFTSLYLLVDEARQCWRIEKTHSMAGARERAEARAFAAATPDLFQTINPATGEKGAAYPRHTVDHALSIAANVHRAQAAWRRLAFKGARSFDEERRQGHSRQ